MNALINAIPVDEDASELSADVCLALIEDDNAILFRTVEEISNAFNNPEYNGKIFDLPWKDCEGTLNLDFLRCMRLDNNIALLAVGGIDTTSEDDLDYIDQVQLITSVFYNNHITRVKN